MIQMDEDIIFEVNGQQYSAGKLDAKRQLHIVRRILPVLGGALDETGVRLTSDEPNLKGALDTLGSLPDEQFDYVVDHCLAVTKRRDGDIWAQVSSPAPHGSRNLMYNDIDLVAIGAIVFHVLKRNLSRFFDALPSEFKERARQTVSGLSQ
jgi:hypothetical protein